MPSTMYFANDSATLKSLLRHPFPRSRIPQQVQRELLAQCGMPGTAVSTQLTPPLGDSSSSRSPTCVAVDNTSAKLSK